MSVNGVALAAAAICLVHGGPAQVPAAATAVVVEAQISPDGRTVAFIRAERSTPGEPRGLFLVSFAGGDAQSLVAPTEMLTHVRWSPDGRQIAFVSQPASGTGGIRILVVPPEAGTPRTVADVAAAVTALEWSFDSKRLAYLSGSAASPSIVDVIPAGPSRAGFPDLSPSRGQVSVVGATTLFVGAVGRDQQSLTLSNGRETWIDLSTPASNTRITVMPIGTAKILAPPSWSADGKRFVAVGETQEHGAEVFAGALPLTVSDRPDWVGAPPPQVRRITFSNP